MATKKVDPLAEESEEQQGGSGYVECFVEVLPMVYHETKNEKHECPLVQRYDKVIEIPLNVIGGDLKGHEVKLYGFAKTQKGDWAVYPSIDGNPRPILREVLDSVREYEEKEEVYEGMFSPRKLEGKKFKIGINHIVMKEGGEFYLVETDYQKVKDIERAKENAEDNEESENIAADATKDLKDGDTINPSELPF